MPVPVLVLVLVLVPVPVPVPVPMPMLVLVPGTCLEKILFNDVCVFFDLGQNCAKISDL